MVVLDGMTTLNGEWQVGIDERAMLARLKRYLLQKVRVAAYRSMAR